ncbi:MAG: lytic polysaccharide monooxygenase [Planctomycetes bacterium]|nr:lytic polysaccharide monooxygenase [Planctomycetota bacterium]
MSLLLASASLVLAGATAPAPHGTVVSPLSRVYRVYQSNPENPSFPLAANAVRIDGTSSYYTWNELSRNIPAAVSAGLPPGFDYSPWIPDGQLASAGRVDPQTFGRTYAGLDQVSADWPTTPVVAGSTVQVEFLATAPHNPSVWDVWMTSADWDASTALNWRQMRFLGRPNVTFTGNRYRFDVQVPADRRGHHVLWVAWQRNDPVGEVFFSTSDLQVLAPHDECAGALNVAEGDHRALPTRGASRSAAAASCETGTSGDLWYRVTARCTGTLRAETCVGAVAFDSVISLWTGSCGAPSLLACNDDACGALSAARAPVQAGQSVLLKVAWRGVPPPSFTLSLSYENGTGSITEIQPGCGGAALVAEGAPNPGGFLRYALPPRGQAQLLWIGVSATWVPLCAGCAIGADPAVVATSDNLRAQVPCDAAFVGAVWFTQGADLLFGSCALGSTTIALTPTLRTTIGS